MKGTRWGLHIAALVGIAILLGLGTWQMQRLAWKEGLIAAIETRMKSPPLPLSAIEARFKSDGDVDYSPVTLTGIVLNAQEQFFLSTHDGQSGWNIYAPLQLEDGRMVMLNRGFVPYDLRDPAKRPALRPKASRPSPGWRAIRLPQSRPASRRRMIANPTLGTGRI